MTHLPPALAALAAYRQFLCYQLVPSTTRPGKTDKFPVSPHNGQRCSALDPANWTDAASACAAAAVMGDGYGVGFTFTEDTGLWFIDIDNCHANGVWSPIALKILGMFPTRL